jgi:hypothetical protein
MIRKFKSLVPKKYQKLIANFYPFNKSSPYTQLMPNIEKLNVSDFFLFRLGDYDTVFIAENNLALLIASPARCKHRFYFFDLDGCACGSFEVESELFHYTLNINKAMTGGKLTGGFIHQIEYSDNLLKNLLDDPKEIVFQHRGYSGYKAAQDRSSIFSFVHGNFGTMYHSNSKIFSLSRQRVKHCYTPQIAIRNERLYEFFFLNSTSKKLIISVIHIDKDNQAKIDRKIIIKPFGSYKYELDTFNNMEVLNISWQSALPVGRAVIFENNGVLFDVFHS